MKKKEKEKILRFISIVIIVVNLLGLFLGNNSFSRILGIIVGISIIVLSKKLKNLYPLSAIFGVAAIVESYVPLMIIYGCGMFSTFMKSDNETDLGSYIKKHTLLSSVVLGISGISLISFGAIIQYAGTFDFGLEMLQELTAVILLGVIIYICHRYHWIVKSNASFIDMVKVSLPIWLVLLFLVVNEINANLYVHEFQSFAFIVIFLINYLLVGLFEEFLMRGLVLNVLLERYKSTPKKVWFAVVVSSVIFGAAHFMNLSVGASLAGVAIQVAGATAMGIYLAAIYLRTNNIWYNALLHGLWDAGVTISYIFVENKMDYGDLISGYSPIMLLSVLFYVGLAMFVLRKKKMKGVIAKLNDKEYTEPKRPVVLGFQHFFAGFIIFFFIIMYASAFAQYKNINKCVVDMTKDFPTYYDYDVEYLFRGDFVVEDLTPDIKLFMASSYLDVNIKDKTTFRLNDEDIKDSYKKLFGKDLPEEDIVDFEYSRNYSCIHDDNKYTCTYKGGIDTNIEVYFGIKDYEYDTKTVKVNMYYLVDDLDNNRVYGDSSLDNLLYSGIDLNSLVEHKYNKDDSYNKKFFKELSEYFEIPVYTLEFEYDSVSNNLVFKNIKLSGEELDLPVDTPDGFERKDYVNRSIFKLNKTNYLEVRKVSQSEYMEKLINTTALYVENNKYYYNSLNDVYLTNKKEDYYEIRIINDDYSLNERLINLLGKIEF